MAFSGIRDQEVATRLLRQVLMRGRVPNAMLFWGPGGVGKFLTAKEMAKAVICTQAAHDSCGECLPCRKIASGNHPDVKVVVPAAKARAINREQVDEINEAASLRPYEAAWRVIIIQDAERMNQVAQNHFLKTLEEPPGKTLFLLLSEYPRMLLPTIRSRCQLVRFRALRPETVTELLQRDHDLPEELARSIAGISQGQMSRAKVLVESETRDLALDIVQRLREGEDPVILAEAFSSNLADQRKQIEARISAELDEASEEVAGAEEKAALKEHKMAQVEAAFRRDILDYLYLLETWYRDELVYSATDDSAMILNRDQVDRLSGKISLNPGAKIAAIEKARLYLDRYVNEERVFRDLFFALAAK